MSIRNLLIRLAANAIYSLRRRTLKESASRFLVFTGTSGKTLARTATEHVLRQSGVPVISPGYGYTNELGILLAGLGIGPIRLFSYEGLLAVMFSRPPEDAYICIELGADWRKDIAWFISRFIPYGVCITTVTSSEWSRPLTDIWADKRRLIEAVPPSGFVCVSGSNESIEQIRALFKKPHACRTEKFSVAHTHTELVCTTTAGTHTFQTSFAAFLPYREAFGAATACMELMGKGKGLTQDVFSRYMPPESRLHERTLTNGTRLISDTYKAVPQCSAYVLTYALSLPAKKRIAVASAFHPLWMNELLHYRNLAEMLAEFDVAYFIGPERAYRIVEAVAPQVVHTRIDAAHLAAKLRSEAGEDTVIVVKTAGRYHMDALVAKLVRDIA